MLLNLFSKMILSIVGWMCLFTLCQSKVIEVNNEGKDSNNCCIEGTCLCGSLFRALRCVENNTVINITSSVPLHNTTHIETLNNITITGNNVTVECNNRGNILCINCSNIVIHGITWNQCGDPNCQNVTHAIGFKSVNNVSIKACIFQHSNVCTVVLLQLLSGCVEVHDSRFLLNGVTNLSQCTEMHASLAIVDRNFKTMKKVYFSGNYYNYNYYYYYEAPVVSVSIVGTSFSHNGASDYTNQYVRVPSSATLLCFLTGQQVVKLRIQNVNVSNSSGLGASLFFLEIDDGISLHFTNVTFYDNNGGSIVRIRGYSDVLLWINSCSYVRNVNGTLKLVIDAWTSKVVLHKLTINENIGTFVGKDQIFGKNSIGHGVGILIWTHFSVNMSLCNIQHNSGGKSIAYIHGGGYGDAKVLITSSNFTNNSGSALHVSNSPVELGDHILFMNNSAGRGAAIYLEQNSPLSIGENSVLEFIGNIASQQGGAIYVDVSYDCDFETTNTLNVSFTNNSAEIAGNSIYFNNPKSCCITSNSLIYKFNYSQPPIGLSVSTSPCKINLCSTACIDTKSNVTKSNCHLTSRIMLGQLVGINATVCDCYGNVSETTQFYVECTNCNNAYKLSSNRIIVHNKLFNVTFLSIDHNDVVNKANVTLQLSSVFPKMDIPLTATLSLELSDCQSGYVFDANLQHCRCYDQYKSVQCRQDYVEIKQGYWFGVAPSPKISSKRTVSQCPIHYCNYNGDEMTRKGYYKLPKELNDQCNSHRMGVACGECETGYTLTYDSHKCTEDVCHPGMIVLVVALTILYYIIIVALVFGLMQRKVSLGYAYGLIYYYSIIDTVLGSNLFISEEVFQLVSILSSFAKLTPQFLGKMCFIPGLSGIDQLFIHYFHAISIFLLIIVIVKVARHSSKIASIVSHCIIRVICLLILLSYTSLASTSLQLLRPLHFEDINDVYVYSSPSIKYFTRRHIAYGIIALLCELFIVIGLPLLLLLEPFLQRKVNFIKIKPLLDQFQECYKDQYHWFAAYYLVCRQVIIAIVYIGQFTSAVDYYLQTACIIIVTIHVWIKPYKNETLNVLDGIILLTAVLVANLNLFTFLTSSTTAIVVILVIFPLLLSCLIYGRKFLYLIIKCSWNHKKVDNNQETKAKYVYNVYIIW